MSNILRNKCLNSGFANLIIKFCWTLQLKKSTCNTYTVPVICNCPGPDGIPRSIKGCDIPSLDKAKQDGNASNGIPCVSKV